MQGDSSLRRLPTLFFPLALTIRTITAILLALFLPTPPVLLLFALFPSIAHRKVLLQPV